MKIAFICSSLLITTASAFSPCPSFVRPGTSMHALGDRFRRGNDNDVAVLEKPITEEPKTEMNIAVPETITEATTTTTAPMLVEEEEVGETQKLMQQVKDAGLAGVISYALWELGFWTISVPVCIAGYRELTGHWPDFQNQEDIEKLGAEAFAFVNFARFAVPLRIGLALGTTPWIQENLVDRFVSKDDDEVEEVMTTKADGSE